MVDEVWLTTVGVATAKARLMARNHLSAEQAEARINSQMSNEERRKRMLVEIPNDGDEDSLRVVIKSKLEAFKVRYCKLSAFEMVDVVDKDDQVLYATKRAVVRAFNLTCRCSYIILVHAETKDIFVQKRSNLKDFAPGLLDPAPGGVLAAGENYLVNAQREMEEEMGLSSLALKHVSAMYHEDATSRVWGTIFYAVVDVSPCDLKLQPEEVDSVILMKPAEILSKPESDFIPDGIHAFRIFHEKCKEVLE
mmetsp:Transcript_41477/g.66645  ORF Transcript_41477/g.66645 Transcript_41477/m.66645 type:complete len:251 (+) Transcript_41477:460-1212(+)